MFSQNRYGNRGRMRYVFEHHLDKGHLVKTKDFFIRKNQLSLIQQYPLSDVQEYYEDDQFYTQHVKAEEWFEKEKEEYEAGLWNPYFDYLMSRMNPDLPLLDVGCGAGWFMDYWSKNSEEYFIGIEPSKLASDAAYYENQFYIFPSIPKSVLTAVKTDWNILMSLVLEHIPNPVEFIQQYLPYMGKTGTLTIIVPNEFNPLQIWLGSTHFTQKVHVNYFTPISLFNVVYKALDLGNQESGVVYHMSTTFPMELFELMGFHYIENGELGAKCHKFRLLFEKFFKKRAFQLYERLFDKYGWGRELVFTVRMAHDS